MASRSDRDRPNPLDLSGHHARQRSWVSIRESHRGQEHRVTSMTLICAAIMSKISLTCSSARRSSPAPAQKRGSRCQFRFPALANSLLRYARTTAHNPFGRVCRTPDRRCLIGLIGCQRSGRPPPPPPRPPGLACPAQLTSDPAKPSQPTVPDACREGLPQKAHPPAKPLRCCLSCVIRRHGQNHGRFIRRIGGVGNPKMPDG